MSWTLGIFLVPIISGAITGQVSYFEMNTVLGMFVFPSNGLSAVSQLLSQLASASCLLSLRISALVRGRSEEEEAENRCSACVIALCTIILITGDMISSFDRLESQIEEQHYS